MRISVLGRFLANSARRVHAVQVRHADIQDRDVRLQLLGLRNSFAAGMRFSADFPSRVRLQHAFDPTPHKIVIVCNQNPKHFHFILPHDGVRGAIVQLAPRPRCDFDRLHRWDEANGESVSSGTTLLPFVINFRAAVLPALRLVYESTCIPGPTRLEAEQPADEFVYEIKNPRSLYYNTSRTNYGIVMDKSIGVIL